MILQKSFWFAAQETFIIINVKNMTLHVQQINSHERLFTLLYRGHMVLSKHVTCSAAHLAVSSWLMTVFKHLYILSILITLLIIAVTYAVIVR